jgi:site-specific DNA-methyltransferase (adenine-specific)
MQDIQKESIDFILCDLPYGVTDCKWDNLISFPELWEQYERVIKPNGAIALFSIQPFTTRVIQSNLKHFRYCWYWKKNNKTGAPFAKVQPMRCIEDICIFYKHRPTYNPQGIKKLDKPIKPKRTTGGVYQAFRGEITPQQYTNYPVNLIEFNGVNSKERQHPTQKPVALLEYLIKTYTNEGETVLDNCMGSGSTGVACMNTGRKFIGIEKDIKYYQTSLNRIKSQQTIKQG